MLAETRTCGLPTQCLRQVMTVRSPTAASPQAKPFPMLPVAAQPVLTHQTGTLQALHRCKAMECVWSVRIAQQASSSLLGSIHHPCERACLQMSYYKCVTSCFCSLLVAPSALLHPLHCCSALATVFTGGWGCATSQHGNDAKFRLLSNISTDFICSVNAQRVCCMH